MNDFTKETGNFQPFPPPNSLRQQPHILPQFEMIFGPTDRSVTLKNLQHIAECFALIPYENITKILRIQSISDPLSRLRLPDVVLSDYRLYRTGGTCFSLVYCLKNILQECGYRCAVHLADLGSSHNNHCALVIQQERDSHLIDPGYLITTPLKIPDTGHAVHPTRLYPVRLEKNQMDGSYYLSTLEPEGEKFRYRLHPHPVSERDFTALWIDSFSWNMMHSLLITKSSEQGRVYLHDRHVRYFTREGKRGSKIRENPDETIAAISGINLDLVQKARRYLAQSKTGLRGR
ncbi:arylamine N-acetyltransferase [bacterium]|nr:arylamine N-acetyltransferase [candidate division CSSED10-310 bacterium]